MMVFFGSSVAALMLNQPREQRHVRRMPSMSHARINVPHPCGTHPVHSQPPSQTALQLGIQLRACRASWARRRSSG